MVAIVSGNGLGLANGSAGVLGQKGVFGNAVLGSNKEGAYVNVATGNLALQDSDEFLPRVVSTSRSPVPITRSPRKAARRATG